jgi:hypothetical protein
VNKSRMRRALDVVLKRLGKDNTTTEGLRLNPDEERHRKPAAAAPPPLPAGGASAPPPMPGGLKLKS